MGGFRIGSIFGIEIRIDPSWFIIFFLLLWTLSFGIFPADVRGLSMATYVGMGVVATLLFFGSLLAHELMHSLVARSRGVRVSGITLFIFGGVSRLRQEATNARDEFLIAAVGPLSSYVIGALFGAILWIGTRSHWPVAVTGVARYLSYINVILATFNLLPGFPLDGGRLLRSAVWKATGDFERATRVASSAGRFFGYALMALGILQGVLTANLVGGLWLVLIGWFLRNAATASYQQLRLRKVLEDVRVQDAMERDFDVVPPDLTLQQLADYFLRRRHDAYPVAENGHPLGLVDVSQLRRIPQREWSHHTVNEVMVPADPPSTVQPEDRLSSVLDKMQETGSRQLLVVKDQHIEGIVSSNDIGSWLQRMERLKAA
jgi:Zn-dependent protease/CBS domain-containing protein